jgi:hypothetical protein
VYLLQAAVDRLPMHAGERRQMQVSEAGMTLPHLLPITCPGAWCFICGDPYNDCTTPEQCGVVRPAPPSEESK